jgi:hypothetical protein
MHAHRILENLARIDLEAGQDPMRDLLDELRDPEPTYFFISSNDDQHVFDAFQRLLAQGMQVRWVIPASMSSELRVDEDANISRWDVRSERLLGWIND